MAGAVASGSAINYGAFAAGKAGSVGISGTNATVCSPGILGQLLTGNAFPATGSVTYTAIPDPAAADCTGAGTITSCGVQGTKGTTVVSATATIVCTG